MGYTGLRFSGALVGLCLCMAGAPAVAVAADKDMIELQRQMATLNERVANLLNAVNTLQMGLSEKLGAQGILLQQSLDGIGQVRHDQAASAKSLADSLSQQEQKIAAPVAALNSRLDQMIQSVSTAAENLTDMNTRLGKMEQRMADMENLIKTFQSNAAAQQAAGGPPPGVTAQGLFTDATRDQLSNKLDLAFQGYSDYLKYFGDTESAAGAQFHIGEILVAQGKPDQAIQAFDLVAGQFPMSAKAPDALYKKAEVLKQQNRRSQATQVLNQLVQRYPDSDSAARAKADLAPAAHK